MQTATIETTTKTTSRDTAAHLALRERETSTARAALADAEREEAVASQAYQDEMSEPRLAAWRAASERRERCTMQLRAFEGRERRARETHDAQIRNELRAELNVLEAAADVDATLERLLDGSAAFALEVDRKGAQRLAADRETVRAQKAAAARARSIASTLGVTTNVRDVELDEARIAANVAIAKARASTGRTGLGIEVFIDPQTVGDEEKRRAEELLARKGW